MDNFNVQIYNQQNQPKAFEKIKNFLTIPKVIFIILGVIILIELISAIRILTAPVSPVLSKVNPVSVKPTDGKILLGTSKTNFHIGEMVPIAVTIDTGGHGIAGADLILHFDPQVLEATSGSAIKGKTFDDYPLVSVNAKNGLVSISGIDNLNNHFKGTGLFAMINFRAKAAGQTQLTIDFQKGSTTSSNLVDVTSSKNILGQVNSLQLKIQ